MKNNIDDAFMRRFNSVLNFPFPDAESRKQIWQLFLPEGESNTRRYVYRQNPGEDPYPDRYAVDCGTTTTELDTNIPEAVKKYELSGGSIINVIHYAGIKAVQRYHEAKEERKLTRDKPVLVESGNSPALLGPENCHPEPIFIIYLSDVLEGIKKEMLKEGKPFQL